MLKLTTRRQLWCWMQNTNAVILRSRPACTSAPMPEVTPPERKFDKPNKLVASVFEALRDDSENPQKINISIPSKSPDEFLELRKLVKTAINNAKDVPTLLSITEKNITYQESLRIMSTLVNWASKQKVKLSDFETDERFKKLCKAVGKQSNKIFNSFMETNQKSEDLYTVLGVTGDDEAAKLIANLSIPQMIKVMSNLALKKRRSTPLLRALSYNITRHTDILDLKKCADLLYSMAILNFPDSILMERIFSDIEESLPKNNMERTSVVSSIMTSIGLLKYKNEKTLNMLLEWILNNFASFKSHDVISVVFTMAILNHLPTECGLDIEKLLTLKESDCPKASSWLDYVWSLVVLNRATVDHVSSVLKPGFIDSLKITGDVPYSTSKRLCNINGYASTLKDYKGSLLPKELLDSVEITYSKEKIVFVNLLLETLKSLLNSNDNLKRNCNTNMGFLYDAECLLDSKCNPYSLNSKTTKKDLSKIAILALDYHDFCRGTMDPIGPVSLYKRLLEAQDYKVLLIKYAEFRPRDNLASRVQYIEKILKETVKETRKTSKTV